MGKQCIDHSHWRTPGNSRFQSTPIRKGSYSTLLFLCLILLVLGSGCGVSKVRITNNARSESLQQTPKPNPNLTKNLSSSSNDKNAALTASFNSKQTPAERIVEYIEIFGPVAQGEMETFRIPASITLAQGLLESSNGSGRLAQEANNHFGIKCHTGWNGKRIYHDDDRKGECFRVYQNPISSYRDHSLFLTERRRYAFLFDFNPTDYKAWARGLKKAGYATDPKYPQKLISLIERYQLDRFDKQIKFKKRRKKTLSKDPVSSILHTVVQGDTLYSIARKYNVALEALIRLNTIENNTIYPGQKLKIPQ